MLFRSRGFWVLDNIAPLRQMNGAVASAASHLYAPPVAIRSGVPVTITWQLAQSPRRATLEVLDSTGTVLRRWENDTSTAPAAGAAAVSFSQRRSTVPVESSTSSEARRGDCASCHVMVTGTPERTATGGAYRCAAALARQSNSRLKKEDWPTGY